ncbi:hypothetical protein D0Z07_5330 [Hyphodiscus hymeniophilus]|uniref:Mso1 N-terminal domain-containing protein n=1 Tax=Hyphodiscus hymeniophilus TaxID=353542 RepID=A0A9P7AWG3_9HELO|nr:hypothetical protein D0Z07_5330 [Hyphodiscus hymeniophilus]
MASYFSSLLTTTTSRVASIRQNLLPSENDGDTEDDTHLCRVLRAYYTEKGRPFPAWLPPDPKAPPPVVVQPVYAQSNVGARYGGLQNQGGTGGGALSSLWDSQPQSQQAPPQSLRQGRGAMSAGSPASRQNPFARQQNTLEPQIQARPLPSQRVGSYQTAGAGAFGRASAGDTPPGSSSGISAQDRLKKKLGQGRVSSNPSMAASTAQAQRNSSYESSTSRGGDNYEDRFMPTGTGGRGDKPFVAANSPWVTNDMEFGGGGDGYDAPPARQGLPSGPAAGRRGPGLPSGPRGPRF